MYRIDKLNNYKYVNGKAVRATFYGYVCWNSSNSGVDGIVTANLVDVDTGDIRTVDLDTLTFLLSTDKIYMQSEYEVYVMASCISEDAYIMSRNIELVDITETFATPVAKEFCESYNISDSSKVLNLVCMDFIDLADNSRKGATDYLNMGWDHYELISYNSLCVYFGGECTKFKSAYKEGNIFDYIRSNQGSVIPVDGAHKFGIVRYAGLNSSNEDMFRIMIFEYNPKILLELI